VNRPTSMQRWASRVALPADSDGCWLWLGRLTVKGYGQFAPTGLPSRLAQCYGYEQFVGPIPEGFHLDHFRMNAGPRRASCSRSCVNPQHVEPATPQENTLRGESIQAKNARKTHCIRGHELSGDNVFRKRINGVRQCLVCERLRDTKRRAMRRVV